MVKQTFDFELIRQCRLSKRRKDLKDYDVAYYKILVDAGIRHMALFDCVDIRHMVYVLFD